MSIESTFRERMTRYYVDMAVTIALSTHKDSLDRAEADIKLTHEIASLAAQIAIEKYDTENRTIIAQADSYERMNAWQRAIMRQI